MEGEGQNKGTKLGSFASRLRQQVNDAGGVKSELLYEVVKLNAQQERIKYELSEHRLKHDDSSMAKRRASYPSTAALFPAINPQGPVQNVPIEIRRASMFEVRKFTKMPSITEVEGDVIDGGELKNNAFDKRNS